MQKTINLSGAESAPDNTKIFDSKAYKRSRKAYMAQCTIEYFVSILVADAFLAKLLTYIGISDSLTGIISSFISLAFMFQILAIPLVKHMKNTKKTVLIFDTLSQIFFMSIYIIPFMPLSTTFKTVLVIVSVLVAYFAKYLIYSIFFKWANSYVEPSNRGEYSAVKEMISLFSGIIFTLAVGFIIDKFEAIGNLEGGFLFIATVMLALNFCNFVSILKIKNDDAAHEEKHSLKDVLKHTTGNKNFINVMIMTSLWDMGRYVTIGFMGTFKTNDLLLSVGIVQVINMIGNLIRLFVSKPFGRYSDKTSFAKGFNLALLIAAVGFGVNIFAATDRVWCVVVFTIMYAVCLAGTNQNSFNIIYSYVDGDYIVPAMSVKNCVGGLLGFGASLVGGKILSMIQSSGNTFLGFHVFGQQVLSAISLILLIAAMVVNKAVIQKQSVIKQ